MGHCLGEVAVVCIEDETGGHVVQASYIVEPVWEGVLEVVDCQITALGIIGAVLTVGSAAASELIRE